MLKLVAMSATFDDGSVVTLPATIPSETHAQRIRKVRAIAKKKGYRLNRPLRRDMYVLVEIGWTPGHGAPIVFTLAQAETFFRWMVES